MNVTLGVPRLKEIINASKSVSTPIMDVYLDDSKSLEAARTVKGRLEKTTLGEISSDISSVLGRSGAYILVTLDKHMARALELDANRVADEILKMPKLKLKEKNIDVRCDSKIRVHPTWDEDEKNMLFRLHHLLKELPKVIVQGINTVERAVIKNNNGEYNLVVEGLDLKKVLGTAGVDHRETK